MTIGNFLEGDREWLRPEIPASPVVRRIVQRHCASEPLLRNVWLCESGE